MAAMLASEPVIMYSEVLDFNADCAEFCPLPGLNYLLALGTYQLLEETQERLGRCYLRALQLSGAAEQPQGSTNAGSLDMPGIFDLKWRPPACDTRKAMLGAALADGTVRLMEVVAVFEDGAAVTRPQLRLQSQVAACSSGMCLSLDWQAAHGGAVARIATSSSAGTLSLLQATNSELSHLCEWKAHDLEAWCTAFHKAEENILFSGADDCYFKAYDIRSDPASPIFSNRRTHAAGVCTVSPHPKEHHIVATGSYDEHVRIWDMRNTSKPVVISQLNTGGGNWRLRWHPHDGHVLLAACMYNGFGVLRCTNDFHNGLALVAMYQSPNKHIAYGADWWQGRPASAETSGSGSRSSTDKGNRTLAATCTFYDRQHRLVWLSTE